MIFLNYEMYKNARDASWNCLIECQIDRLPVNVFQICKHYNLSIIKNSSLTTNKLKPNERAKNMLISGKYYVIVDDSETIQAQRYSILHEIGHILIRNASEYEAERFAIGVLAPACVLWGLNVHTAKDIAKLCNISPTSAQIRAKRMEVLYQRNKFFLSPLEKQVFAQFQEFIKESQGLF